jgi:predicted dehydrogenase
MMDKIRWGILGTGGIAARFADGLTALPDAELIAVGSRAKRTADAFADRFDIGHRHASYDALAQDDAVDAVYVATPHPYHHEHSILCLRAGKAVLCEKPFTINAAEAEDVINVARQEGRFLMEAMWSRFLPSIAKVRELLEDGAIGDLRLAGAEFGFRAPLDPKHRLFDLQLGGGALLDVGVYAVSFASMVFGPPARVVSMAHLGETGVDEQSAMILGYGEGQLFMGHAAVRTNTPQEASLVGTEGWIRIHSPWWRSDTITLTARGTEKVFHLPFKGNGYNYEAAEVAHCLRSGRLESAVMPLAESLQIMQTLDQIRGQWGLRYPME